MNSNVEGRYVMVNAFVRDRMSPTMEIRPVCPGATVLAHACATVKVLGDTTGL